MERKYYVAYGSNLNVSQMQMRCPTATMIGTSTIKDYRLMFKGSKTGSYLTIEPEVGCEVPVGIWSVTEADERALDRYEGYPHFYYKKELILPVKSVRTGRIRKLKTFVYIMHEERKLGIPSRQYMHTCLIGYMDFDLDATVLLDAYDYSNTEAMK